MTQKIIFFVIVSVATFLPYKCSRSFFSKMKNWTLSLLLSFWFLFWSAILFLKGFSYFRLAVDLFVILFAVTITFIWIIFPILVRKFGRAPAKLLNNPANKQWNMLRFDPKFTSIKYFEVLTQEMVFLFLYFVLLKNVSQDHRVLFFASTVAFFHLGNFFTMHTKWVLFYFLLSIPMGLIWGILLEKGMVLITFGLHLLFYLIFNAYFWLVKSDKYRDSTS